MFTQYNKELQRWEVYKLVQKGNKIKAYQIAAEQTKEAAIRKMHELYEERGLIARLAVCLTAYIARP